MPFQILCLSGGGYLGLYSAAVLAAFEEHSGRPIIETFDLIAGTSVGGIIALGLAHRVPAASIRDIFLDKGAAIFSDRPPAVGLREKVELAKSAGSARFKSARLRETIEAILGSELIIGDLEARVIIPSLNLTKGQPQVFKTPHHETFIRDWRLKVVDVAMATSAAPTYFPIHRIGGEMFADGGLYANSPDELALHEAEHFLNQPRSEIRVLSVGTTSSKFSLSSAVSLDLGWIGWMSNQRLTSAMIASQQLLVDYTMSHKLGSSYIRIDQVQSKEQEAQLRLDVASTAAKNDLLGLAEASVRQHLATEHLQGLFRHRAPPPHFFTAQKE